jgi:hypothetical protein
MIDERKPSPPPAMFASWRPLSLPATRNDQVAALPFSFTSFLVAALPALSGTKPPGI